ncbi:unnamed protein product [Lota lota]
MMAFSQRALRRVSLDPSEPSAGTGEGGAERTTCDHMTAEDTEAGNHGRLQTRPQAGPRALGYTEEPLHPGFRYLSWTVLQCSSARPWLITPYELCGMAPLIDTCDPAREEHAPVSAADGWTETDDPAADGLWDGVRHATWNRSTGNRSPRYQVGQLQPHSKGSEVNPSWGPPVWSLEPSPIVKKESSTRSSLYLLDSHAGEAWGAQRCEHGPGTVGGGGGGVDPRSRDGTGGWQSDRRAEDAGISIRSDGSAGCLYEVLTGRPHGASITAREMTRRNGTGHWRGPWALRRSVQLYSRGAKQNPSPITLRASGVLPDCGVLNASERLHVGMKGGLPPPQSQAPLGSEACLEGPGSRPDLVDQPWRGGLIRETPV